MTISNTVDERGNIRVLGTNGEEYHWFAVPQELSEPQMLSALAQCLTERAIDHAHWKFLYRAPDGKLHEIGWVEEELTYAQ